MSVINITTKCSVKMNALPLSRCHKYCRHSIRYILRRKLNTSPDVPTTTSHIPKPVSHGEIVIPRRVNREPTSILRALASTVKKDYQNPPYKYIDDPETIPTSTIAKKAYSLAKASGQRAAQYVIKTYPEYFTDSPADPPIEAFMPRLEPQFAEDTEEGLRERIELRDVDLSISSYRKNVDTGTELSEDALCDLLDLLAVYNSEAPKDPLLPHEQEFSRMLQTDGSRDRIRKTWKDDGVAEEVFSSLEDVPQRAYCSMIRGRAKFLQTEKAFELFQQMRDKGIECDLETYNSILGLAGYLQNRLEDKISFIKEIFLMMQKSGVVPSLDTFNMALSNFPRSARFNPPLVARFTSSLLNEMSACGIEPSLATWNHVTRIFYFTDESQSGVLHDILDRLQGRDLAITHPEDMEFFSTVMAKCYVNLKDLELAYKIDDLLSHGQNYKVLGDNFREGLYYNFFLKVLCMFEQIDTIMEYYEKIVPHSFSPTFSALDDLFEAIELNEGYEYLPRIWSDVYTLGYERSVPIMEKVTRLMAKVKHPDSLQKQMHRSMHDQFETVVANVNILEEKDRLRSSESLPLISAPLLSNMCQISLYAEEVEDAIDMFNFYMEYKNQITGTFVEKTCVALADIFIKNKDIDASLEVLRIMSDCTYSSIDVTADRLTSEAELSQEQRQLVKDLL